ncbi:MAG: hypothetical protein ACYSU0_10450 [Planctomycetota bacterium]
MIVLGAVCCVLCALLIWQTIVARQLRRDLASMDQSHQEALAAQVRSHLAEVEACRDATRAELEQVHAGKLVNIADLHAAELEWRDREIDRLDTLRHGFDRNYAAAMRLKDSDPRSAILKATASEPYDDHTRALQRRLVDQLQRKIQRETQRLDAIEEGDRLFESGGYWKATRKYRDALNIRDDSDVRAKFTRAWNAYVDTFRADLVKDIERYLAAKDFAAARAAVRDPPGLHIDSPYNIRLRLRILAAEEAHWKPIIEKFAKDPNRTQAGKDALLKKFGHNHRLAELIRAIDI